LQSAEEAASRVFQLDERISDLGKLAILERVDQVKGVVGSYITS
jgi:hypothetical protein